MKHADYIESHSSLYLAMVSLVSDRKIPHYKWQKELYKDFKISGIYNINVVERWIECGIFESIGFWLGENYEFINYIGLSKDNKEYILSCINRINDKYKGKELSNKLFEEVTDDFSSHYLEELYLRLKELEKGVEGLNLNLIISSLLFGVLIPFGLLLIQSEAYWFSYLVGITASINSGLISYFILRFPTLIKKEIKWI